MPFAYFDFLSEPQKTVYLLSDARRAIRLPRPRSLHPWVSELKEALAEGAPAPVTAAAQQLSDGVLSALRTPPVELEVLEIRPTLLAGELHGLYNGDAQPPLIQLWMRTARYGRVVAFRTFLRTLLHELCHHLDVEYLGLPYSFHTHGFFCRETSLFHQLLPEARRKRHPNRGGAGWARR